MDVDGTHYRTIWVKEGDDSVVQIIDQRSLPHEFVVEDLASVDDVCIAIKDMHVRGAGLIGATAGYGMYLAARTASKESFEESLAASAEKIKSARPTAQDLFWAVDRQRQAMASGSTPAEKIEISFQTANDIADEYVEMGRLIGEHGLGLITEIAERKNGDSVNVLTHCNAGWLAFVDYGSATAPIYAAHDAGIPVHVWVDETRPRCQGSRLTAWELGQHGVPYTVICDNVGGHLMQHGMVDVCIVGSDRMTATGDVANKIGTYLKALAAKDNGVPFYVALPSSTIDWSLRDGVADIPIEQRGSDEVKYARGLLAGSIQEVLLTPDDSPTANYAFDVTPARLVSGLITEKGVCEASEEGIRTLFPEKASRA